ncbi:MAG: (d)CMP kinase [Synergistaceae bacterium]|jgi:cytidylate kinase|nr:(d)CMP kinase [Synergistaceae bacterium]
MSFVVTVDGPAGAGKSSVAKRLAKLLNIRYLDTGAIYRAVAYFLDKKGVVPSEGPALKENVTSIGVRIEGESLFVNGEEVTQFIRSQNVDCIVSRYAALETVRNALLNLQRNQAKDGALIAEGRDTGSVVFPDADIKFFLTASLEARAKRRYQELLGRGEAVVYQDVVRQMYERDRTDSHREIAPLREPRGAIRIDTSSMEENKVVNELAFIIRSRITQDFA